MSCCAECSFKRGRGVENANIRNLTLDLVNGLSKATDVLACDTGNGDTTILGGVYGVLLIKSVYTHHVKVKESSPPWLEHPSAQA